jgi:hypothetical protein
MTADERVAPACSIGVYEKWSWASTHDARTDLRGRNSCMANQLSIGLQSSSKSDASYVFTSRHSSSTVIVTQVHTLLFVAASRGRAIEM